MWNGKIGSVVWHSWALQVKFKMHLWCFCPESQAYAIHVWLSGLDWLSYSALSKSGTYLQNLLVMGETRSKLISNIHAPSMIYGANRIHTHKYQWCSPSEDRPGEGAPLATAGTEESPGSWWHLCWGGAQPLGTWALRAEAHMQALFKDSIMQLCTAWPERPRHSSGNTLRDWRRRRQNRSRICRKQALVQTQEWSLSPTNPAVRAWWWQGAINAEVYAKQDAASYVRKVGPEGYKSNGCFS